MTSTVCTKVITDRRLHYERKRATTPSPQCFPTGCYAQCASFCRALDTANECLEAFELKKGGFVGCWMQLRQILHPDVLARLCRCV